MSVGQRNAQHQVPLRRLGELIVQCENRNADLRYGVDDVRGVSNTKNIQRTKANIDGRALDSFHVVTKGGFVFNRRTTRNGERLGLGYNNTDKTFIFTEDYVSFRVKDENVLDPDFLYILFLRDEFDRYVRWDSWGSATEFFNWENMCRVEIPVPSIDVQRKIAASWRGLRTMKQENEELVEPLMQLCRSRLQEIKKQYPMREIGPMIRQVDERCKAIQNDVDLSTLKVLGVNFQKEFIPTAANMDGIDVSKYKVMRPGRFVFSGMQTGRDACIRLGLWSDEEEVLVSPAYTTFELKPEVGVLDEYFFLMFRRPEMDRLGWFYSDSSVRSNLDWPRFESITIPLPPVEVQQAVVDLFRCANEAKKIAAEADDLSRACCPALVQFGVKGAA